MERIKKINDQINIIEKKVDEEETLAMIFVKNALIDKKRWFISFLVVVSCWLLTIGGFLYYILNNTYEETIVTTEIDTNTGDSSNGSINIGGDVING